MTKVNEGAGTISDLRSRLEADHRAVHVAFERMVLALREGNEKNRDDAWRAFDHGLRTHMAFEEDLVFPELDKVDPREVHDLVADHCRIRALLGELDMHMQLSLGCKAMLGDLGQVLREHAKRESAVLYRWCDEGLCPGTRNALARQHAHTLGKPAL